MFGKERVELKSPAEIEKIRVACRVVGEVLDKVKDVLKPGISTKDVDVWIEKYIRSLDMVPAFLGVEGLKSKFPASSCISINDEVIHGVPSSRRLVKSGDIVSVDVGVIYQGYYGDGAKTYPIGEVSAKALKLVETTSLCLDAAIEQCRVGKRLGDVSSAIQRTAESAGFSVVRDYVGHGVGRALHEPPQIYNYGKSGTGIRLEAGMTLAIEPMINLGGYEVFTTDDGWTVFTKDGSLSAHFEHTVLIKEQSSEVLTKVQNG